jgi:hypothetical protein
MLAELGMHDAAVQLVASLPPPQAWRLLLRHGASLLACRPAQTSALVVHLCLARRDAGKSGGSDAVAWGGEGRGEEAAIAELLEPFTARPRWLCHVLEQLASQPPQPQPVLHMLLGLYLSDQLEPADQLDLAPTSSISAATGGAAAGGGEGAAGGDEPQPPLLPREVCACQGAGCVHPLACTPHPHPHPHPHPAPHYPAPHYPAPHPATTPPLSSPSPRS